MNKFAASLRKKYKERLLSCEEQWPPVRGDRLINLQLVEADKTEGFVGGPGRARDKVKRSPILCKDLFKKKEGKKPVRKIIVEGYAGIGKTTLCTMLTEGWANGEILTQFECVLLLPLRENLVSAATTLLQLFQLLHSSEKLRTLVVEEIEEREGEGVLIIADGWDELDTSHRRKQSFLYKLFLGSTILPFASVILTSRPSASAPLHDLPTVDRLVEVVGFNEENVKQYIESEFEECPEKASSLIEQLENNPVIQSVCSVPLNCAIICNLWHTLDRVLPKTLTELYTHIVLNIIFRNVRKRYPDISPLLSLSSFDLIPDILCEQFWLTCKFAYECLSQDKIVFTEADLISLLPGFLEFPDSFLSFGVLQSTQTLLPVGHGLSFHFAHLTIQEFLAALHLVTLPSEEKLKVCEAHSMNDRFLMVWKFVFGLGCKKQALPSQKILSLDNKVIECLLSAPMASQRLLCHYALESSNANISSRIASMINYFEGANSPYDCVAIFHVLLYYSERCIDIDLSQARIGDNLMEKLVASLSEVKGKFCLHRMNLCRNKLTDRCFAYLFNSPSFNFSFLKHLSLDYNHFKLDVSPLLLSAPFNNLVFLFLSDNPLGVSGIQSLETAVQAGVLVSLEYLNLSNTLTDDADINGTLLTTLLSSIASHCPSLYEINLSENNLGVPGASALTEALPLLDSSRTFYCRYFSNTCINGEAVCALVHAVNRSLQSVPGSKQ